MAKQIKKRPRTIKAMVYGEEPEYTGFLATIDVVNYLNWCARNFDKKEKKKFALQVAKDMKMDIAKLSTVSEDYFMTVGGVSKLILNEELIPESLIDTVKEKFIYLAEHHSKVEEVKVARIVPRTASVKKDNPKLTKFLDLLDTQIDNILLNKKQKPMKEDIVSLAMGMNKSEKTEMRDYINRHMVELEDKAFFKKYYERPNTDRYNMLTIFQTFNAVLNVISKKRDVSPTKQVAKIRFLKESTEYGFKSIIPEKLIGKQKLIVFNTKTRRVGIYYSSASSGFTFKGATLQSFDKERSVMKTDRKPKENTMRLLQLANKAGEKIFKDIKSIEQKMNGRINKDIILLKVF